MTLENSTTFPKPIIVPQILVNKVKTLTNCSISEREVDIYNVALNLIEKHLKKENIDLSSFFTINVVFTYDGSIAFIEESQGNCGSQMHIAIYRMQKLRELNDEQMMTFVFLEELVHYFWRISDETLVKHKIAEIMQYVFPEFTLDDLRRYKLNGLQ